VKVVKGGRDTCLTLGPCHKVEKTVTLLAVSKQLTLVLSPSNGVLLSIEVLSNLGLTKFPTTAIIFRL